MLLNIFLSVFGVLSWPLSVVSASAITQFIEKSTDYEKHVNLGTVQSIIDSVRLVPELVELAHNVLICETQEDPNVIVELLLSSRIISLYDGEGSIQWLSQIREHEGQVIEFLKKYISLMTIDPREGLSKFEADFKLLCQEEVDWPLLNFDFETSDPKEEEKAKQFAFELKERVPEVLSVFLGILEIVPSKAELVTKLRLYIEDNKLDKGFLYCLDAMPRERVPNLNLSKLPLA